MRVPHNGPNARQYTAIVNPSGHAGRTYEYPVHVHGLHMQYGNTRAVNNLDLTVASGSVTAILGPNGAGKSTTIETCEGFRKAHRGSVRIFGQDPIASAKTLRPRVGVMLQAGGAWSGVRPSELLRHLASMYANPLAVDALMERLGLSAVQGTPYRRLSGGEQQRLGLAMSIIGRPELVFLDEPTAGLDPQARRATWELISELRAHGITIVLTTHFMDEAETLSDFVYIIDHGAVIASGAPAELTSAGAHDTVRFTAVPHLDLTSLTSVLPLGASATEVSPGAYVATGNITPDFLAALTSWCATANVLPESILVERQTLEDRFLDLTGRSLR